MNTRQKILLEKVRRLGKVNYKEECKYFNVSHMTIRRDLRELAEENLVILVTGGAIPYVKSEFEALISKSPTPEQQKIATKALKYIEDGMTIMLGTGSTTLELARAIAASDKTINVVTNSLPNAVVLFKSKTNVFIVGGELRISSLDIIGFVAEKNLDEFCIDKLFMGCNGAIAGEGFFTSDVNLANFETKSVKIAPETIIITESKKFRKRAIRKFASFNDVSMIITDDKIRQKDVEKIEATPAELIIV